MSESKHTPGPWTAHFWNNLDNGTLEPTGKRTIRIEHQVFPDIKIGRALATLDFDNEANARLIAAAPELLDALQDAMRWFAKLEDWCGVGDPNIEKYRAAIAKATGGKS